MRTKEQRQQLKAQLREQGRIQRVAFAGQKFRINIDWKTATLAGHPIAGMRAEVIADDQGKRVTLTRAALTGVFALALRKRKGDVRVVVESPSGFQVVGKARISELDDAFRFAEMFNVYASGEGTS